MGLEEETCEAVVEWAGGSGKVVGFSEMRLERQTDTQSDKSFVGRNPALRIPVTSNADLVQNSA